MTSPGQKSKVTYLRLVESDTPSPRLLPTELAGSEQQRRLFAENLDSLLIFADVSQCQEKDIRTVLDVAKPHHVVDLRVAPRFDYGTLNRKRAFDLFEKAGALYVDYCAISGARNPDHSSLAPGQVAQYLKSLISAYKNNAAPICLLVDDSQISEEFIQAISNSLIEFRSSWDVLRLPTEATARRSEELSRATKIFVSHANPQDNQFAKWIATKLGLAGYEVWVDIADIRSGEKFWDRIEEVIKFEAAVVIAVLSRASIKKEGVLDEIHFSLSQERRWGRKGFLMPVRLDNIPFDELPASVSRRHITDFSHSWADGLKEILRALRDSRVPTTPSAQSLVLDWWSRAISSGAKITSTSETLISNWLSISQLPSEVYFSTGSKWQGGTTIPAIDECPWISFKRWKVSLSRFDAVRGIFGEVSHSIPIEVSSILKGVPDDQIGYTAQSGRNFVSHLIRRNIELQLRRQGFIDVPSAGTGRVFYLPKGFSPSDRVQWRDATGKARRKNLVGSSRTRNVHWHYAIEPRVDLVREPVLQLRAHVVFTTDGKTPLGDIKRMHAMRRGFCRNWWNEQWRDLLLAMILFVTNGQAVWRIRVPDNNDIVLSGWPVSVTAPFSIDDTGASAPEEIDEDLTLDESLSPEEFEDAWRDSSPDQSDER